MSANAEYSYLWDGSEPSWVVVEHTRDEAEVLVAFGVDGPTLAEIKALRSVSAVLKTSSAADVLKQLRGLRSFSLGVHESRVARKLLLDCQSMGLKVSDLPAQEVHRSLINTLTKRFLLIEDEQVCRAVVADAIANGLQIVHSQN
ncbi:hypothetical protein [Delftia tsuruhatensis]|uniref:Uncharacterized protein n=1 Tax=Delftia tsuruhatensis TaxID=180282 RepID=A0AAX3STB7_9BURK|nr:hypothetical protein [Delftia tsuruhatensis]WFF83319.1 hypothetical protein PYR84_11680 [Delftia tsuruhatensis]